MKGTKDGYNGAEGEGEQDLFKNFPWPSDTPLPTYGAAFATAGQDR
jgi:hypothetical protein